MSTLSENILNSIDEISKQYNNNNLEIREADIKARIAYLKAEGKSNLEIQTEIVEQVDQIAKNLDKRTHTEKLEAELKKVKEVADFSLNLDEQLKAKQREEELKGELKKEKRKEQVAAKVQESLTKGIDSIYDKLTQAAEYYSSLVEQVQTRLLGSGKDFQSVSSSISKAFAFSPFFSMKEAMNKVVEFVDKGIAYNVELRASMAVVSTKIARTFDAFDSSLLRLVKIQQEDSTQARLGMESILTQFLNNNYKDTSYLNNLSSTVRSSLLEAESLMSKESAAVFELNIQKWLGSMSSMGASDNLISKLAEGIGALASGDVEKLNANQDMQSLLVMSANNAGLNYGDMLLNAPKPEDIDKLFTGFTQLILQIAKSGESSTVALNQYAKVFGLSVSDLQATVSWATEENIKAISGLNASYDSMLEQVEQQSSYNALMSRTGGADLVSNMMDNMFLNAGEKIGGSAASFLSWQVAGIANKFLEGLETGVDIAPMGVGTHLNLSTADIAQVMTVVAGLGSGLTDISSKLKSMKGVNISALEGSEKNTSGTALQLMSKGQSNSFQTSSIVDTSMSSMYDQAQQASNTVATQVSDKNFKEEEEKSKKAFESFQEIGDSVKFIVQMLNQTGIVIRGRTGMSPVDSLLDTIRVV